MTHSATARRTALLPRIVLLAGLCACSPGSSDRWTDVDIAEVWELGSRGVALCEQHRFEEASEAWAQVVELVPFWHTARINHGIATLNRQDGEPEARVIFEDVLSDFPGVPWAHYCLGILDEREGSFESAREHYLAVLEQDPEDPDTLLRMGLVYQALEEDEQAIRALQRATALNPLLTTGWYALSQSAAAIEDHNLRARALSRFEVLQAGSAGEERAIVFGKMGFYANPIRPGSWNVPRPEREEVEPRDVAFVDASAEAGFERDALRHGGPGNGTFSDWIGAMGADFGAQVSGGIAAVDRDLDGDTDLFLAHWGAGPEALVLDNDGDGSFAQPTSSPGLEGDGTAETLVVATADFDGDSLPDLFLGRDGSDRVLAAEAAGGSFSRTLAGAEGRSELSLSAAVGDLDLDGDLDLAIGNSSGVSLFRWNGKQFEEVDSAPRFRGPAFGLLLADLDGDHDLDLVSGSPAQRVAYNSRLWQWSLPEETAVERTAPVASWAVGDVNADGLDDWVASSPSAPTQLFLTGPDGTLASDEALAGASPSPALSSFLLDADRDGDLDLMTIGSRAGLYLRDPAGGWSDGTAKSGLGALGSSLDDVRGSVLFDADGDGDLDLCALRNGDTPLFLRNETESALDWIAIDPRGIADAAAARGRSLGNGAQVEVTARGISSVAHSGLGGGFASVAPNQLHFILPGADTVDVRIRWADQVLQTEIALAAGRAHVIEQVDREASSCPVVFYWNGERFAYRADFLGGGGLGFLIRPGVFGEPDPEEVLLLGTDLALREGAYEVRVTEPMEEVTYLDRARLVRVVHAPGTLAIPEERFATDGQLATGRVLVVRESELVAPERARVAALDEHDGRRHLELEAPADDLADRLRSTDRSYAGPPAVHRRLLGHAPRWALELSFPAGALLASESEVYLFARGWIEYPYSRLNYAAWQEGLEGEALSLEVPDGEGGWRAVRPAFGTMGGKDRFLALPVGEHLAAAMHGGELRLRLQTNQPVHFDRVFLAPDRSETDRVEVVEIAPESARVGFCGFPRVHSPDGRAPEVYDFAQRSAWSDFKRMPGLYTRYGEARELLDQTDDRFAIIGSGEEVRLRFAPPPDAPGGTRVTWMLRARGYCKDMCPLSASPSAVEPLPFAGMSAYPPDSPLGDEHPSRRSPLNRRREPAASR